MRKTFKTLEALYQQLNAQNQHSLHSFAAFLLQQQEKTAAVSGASAEQQIEQKKDIPRPRQEKVVAAIKRLSNTYPMINKSSVLDQAAQIMTEHMLQGRPAPECIDDLEALFAQHYQDYCHERQKG